MNVPEKEASLPDEENITRHFWSGLAYIIDSFREHGETLDSGYGVDRKTITLSEEEWKAVDNQFRHFEESIHAIWESASQLADDLEEMKWLHPDDAEAYRKACQKMAESILGSLEKYVDDEKVEK
jgi:hypothetical protein